MIFSVLFSLLFCHAAEVAAPALKSVTPSTLPKYEFGLGWIYGNLQDYPGSNEKTVRTFPIPYFVYRGDLLQAERGGLRTRFFKGAYYEYDFSFNGAYPANSSHNSARRGMSDLGWMFEVGPQLKVFLYRSTKSQLTLRLPLRAVFSLDDDKVHGRGYTFSPHLVWSLPKVPFDKNILLLGFTSDFASQKTHEYFYDVRPQYVNADRAGYSASSGILGSKADITVVTMWNHFSFFVNYSFYFYGEAKNKQSPLHMSNRNQSLMAGFVWSFYQSKEQGFR